MTEDTTNNKTCGYMYRCCWPCTCDSMKYAKTMNISHKFKGIEEQFTVMTIDNPGIINSHNSKLLFNALKFM